MGRPRPTLLYPNSFLRVGLGLVLCLGSNLVADKGGQSWHKVDAACLVVIDFNLQTKILHESDFELEVYKVNQSHQICPMTSSKLSNGISKTVGQHELRWELTFIESLAKILVSSEAECRIEIFCSRVSVLATPLLKGFFYIVPHCVSSVSGVRLAD